MENSEQQNEKQKEKIDLKTDDIVSLLADSHAHLSLMQNAEEVVQTMKQNKLCAIVNMAGSITDGKLAQKISSQHKNVYYMVGLHPVDIDDYNDEYVAFLKNLKATDDHFVGVGEIGLDYHGDYKNKDYQKEVFLKQIKLADSLNLPISIHVRDAHSDAIMLLNNNKKYLKHGGILHCFGGNQEEMQAYLSIGLYISFSGSVTFKRNSETETELQRCAKLCPLDRILIETDAPFLCPSPYRGRVNEPKFVLQTARCIADIRCINVNKLIDATTTNLENLLTKKFK